MSSMKEIWAQWDAAWDPHRSIESRLAILKNAVAPTFTYTNPDAQVDAGKLDELAQLIDTALAQFNNKLIVKHINWYEQHGQSALQWDMVDTDTAEVRLKGWSYGKYDADGKLLAVSDFW